MKSQLEFNKLLPRGKRSQTILSIQFDGGSSVRVLFDVCIITISESNNNIDSSSRELSLFSTPPNIMLTTRLTQRRCSAANRRIHCHRFQDVVPINWMHPTKPIRSDYKKRSSHRQMLNAENVLCVPLEFVVHSKWLCVELPVQTQNVESVREQRREHGPSE